RDVAERSTNSGASGLHSESIRISHELQSAWPPSHDFRGSGCPKPQPASAFAIGHAIPLVVCQPGKMSLEPDCAAIRDAPRADMNDGASQHAAANARPLRRGIDVQLDVGSGQQPAVRFDQGTTSGNIDELGGVSRPNPDRNDVVIFDGGAALRPPAIDVCAHSGAHFPVWVENLRIRVLPVWP